MPSRPASERGGSAAAFDGLVDDEPDAEPDTDEADDRGSMLAMFCVSLFCSNRNCKRTSSRPQPPLNQGKKR
jgi:hypothetical protein